MQLVIDSERTVDAPSDDEISDAVKRMGTGRRPSVLYLHEDHDTYLQATGTPKKGLVLEFYDGELHHEVVGAATEDETAAVFRRFNRGEDDWDRGLTWTERSSAGCLGTLVWIAVSAGAAALLM